MPDLHHTLEEAVTRDVTRALAEDIGAGDLTALLAWINANPEVPAGDWCRDFGSFKLAGRGPLPKTFLTREQPCYGQPI